MTLEERFTIAADLVRGIVVQINDNLLAQLYGYFKQAREGNIAFSRPSILNMRGRKMWDAWKSKENMSKENAMEKYVEIVYGLTNKSELLDK
jgi:diazepam-binding inhibitor (GABA receptor modulator, acyl-CoA-binding protein)